MRPSYIGTGRGIAACREVSGTKDRQEKFWRSFNVFFALKEKNFYLFAFCV